MKVVVLFVSCFIAVGLALPAEDEKIKQLLEKCRKASNATADDVENLTDPMGKQPVTHEAKCLIACIHKENGMMDADGKFNKAIAIEHINKAKDKIPDDIYNKLIELVNKCDAEVKIGDDACENAAAMSKCAKKYQKELALPDM